MPIYTQVVASRISKYRAQLERDNGNDADIDMAMFRIAIGGLIDAAFSGGGGGGGATSAATITQGINDAVDIDTLIARLVSIDNKTHPVGTGTIAQSQSVSIASDQVVPIDTRRINGAAIATGIGVADAGTQRVGLSSDSVVAVKSTAVPVAQTTITLATSGTGSYLIPAGAKSVTICITSGALVHYTEDGTAPTAANCWFGGGTKEIWESQIPAGSEIRFLAVAAATISIQVRV